MRPFAHKSSAFAETMQLEGAPTLRRKPRAPRARPGPRPSCSAPVRAALVPLLPGSAAPSPASALPLGRWFDMHLGLSMQLRYLGKRQGYLRRSNLRKRHLGRVLIECLSTLKDALYGLYLDAKHPRLAALLAPTGTLPSTVRRLYAWSERVSMQLEYALFIAHEEAHLPDLGLGDARSLYPIAEFYDATSRLAQQLRQLPQVDGASGLVPIQARVDEVVASVLRLDRALKEEQLG